MNNAVEHDYLTTILSYDQVTGEFTWKCGMNNFVMAGDRAGSQRPSGVWYTRILGKNYLLHRLAWFYVTKAWPASLIDHINGDNGDNRFCNLREATPSQNSQNQKKAKRGRVNDLPLGVDRQGELFVGRIIVKGKYIYLGHHKTPELAHLAYVDAKRKYHSHGTL